MRLRRSRWRRCFCCCYFCTLSELFTRFSFTFWSKQVIMLERDRTIDDTNKFVHKQVYRNEKACCCCFECFLCLSVCEWKIGGVRLWQCWLRAKTTQHSILVSLHCRPLSHTFTRPLNSIEIDKSESKRKGVIIAKTLSFSYREREKREWLWGCVCVSTCMHLQLHVIKRRWLHVYVDYNYVWNIAEITNERT